MAIGDTIEVTDGWRRERVAAIDGELAREGLPSLSAIRAQFSKVIRRAVARGYLNTDVEYYAVRNAAEVANGDEGPLWKLLSAYEQRLAG